jgi:hypothetical protein
MPCSTANGSASCSLGSCSITCNAGYGNCDNNARTNGCEINLLTDKYNCGVCGNVCSGSCTNGSCTGTLTNVAPLGTATISSGGSAPGLEPLQANNNITEAQDCSKFSWITAESTPGTAWIQISWSSSKTVSSINIDTNYASGTSACGQTGRALGGGTLQYLSGSSWITIGTISGKTNDWSYSFSPVITTALRLYGVYAVGGQASNPIVYEWQIMGY